MSLAAVAVAAAGVVVRRPPRRNAWLLLVAGLAAFALGDVIALTTSTRQGLGPADVAYLAAYPLLVAGLHHMRRRGDPALDRAGLVDAAIIGTTAALGYWVFLVGPGIDEGSWSTKAVSVAYLVFDVALLAVATRLVAPGPTCPTRCTSAGCWAPRCSPLRRFTPTRAARSPPHRTATRPCPGSG